MHASHWSIGPAFRFATGIRPFGTLGAMRHAWFTITATALTALVVVGVGAAPARAHAIIDLGGRSAVAGTTSVMTLEVQHGCLPSEATLQVEAFVGAPWRALRPGAVAGWQATVAPLPRGGWHITWANQGAPVPFGTATFFPITADWPTRPGVYSMRVTQQCTNGTSYDWSEQYRPATANHPSPPLTPRPEVLVVAKPEPPSPSPRPRATAPIDAHAH